MKMEISLLGLTFIVGGTFILGAKYGELRVSEKFFSGVSNVLVDRLIEEQKENKEQA